jgi:hypothetical protein
MDADVPPLGIKKTKVGDWIPVFTGMTIFTKNTKDFSVGCGLSIFVPIFSLITTIYCGLIFLTYKSHNYMICLQ